MKCPYCNHTEVERAGSHIFCSFCSRKAHVCHRCHKLVCFECPRRHSMVDPDFGM